MNYDEAVALWQELDSYRYGHISANTFQRWLEDAGQFQIPSTDVHFLYGAFGAKEVEQRISQDQFLYTLCGFSGDYDIVEEGDAAGGEEPEFRNGEDEFERNE